MALNIPQVESMLMLHHSSGGHEPIQIERLRYRTLFIFYPKFVRGLRHVYITVEV